MEILPYQPEMARGLARLYNEVIVGRVPRCHCASVERFARELRSVHDPSTAWGELRNETAFAAMNAGQLLGFIHCGVGPAWEDHPGANGQIRFLCFRPEERDVGAALLRRAERQLAEQEAGRSIAFHRKYRYSFYYRPWANLSSHLAYVAAVLALSGYESYRDLAEYQMEMMDYAPPGPGDTPPHLEIVAVQRPGPGERPDLTVEALCHGQKAGICVCESCARYGDAAELRDLWVAEWLSVEERFRGKGIGRLLMQEALRRMRQLGYRHACLSVRARNAPAILLYTSLGYRVIDLTQCYAKVLFSASANDER